jgi:ubiquinone/menaquinone biosynthesis C-methylase UbiE
MRKNNYLKKINEFFDKNFEENKNSVKSLGWSKKSQKIRFEIFSKITSLKNKTVLDVGSGFGDLAYFLKNKNSFSKYTGYEINKNFFENCKNLKNISFELRNILEKPPKNKFDIVFSIGALNTNFSENEKVMKKLIKVSFDSCKELTAISMTSKYVDKEYKDTKKMYYYDPCKIFTYAKTLTPKVSLLHNYLPHDFTIILYKN